MRLSSEGHTEDKPSGARRMPLALEPSGAFRFVRAPYLSTIDEEDAGAAPAAPASSSSMVDLSLIHI